MKILKELLPGTFLLKPNQFKDSRGTFIKSYAASLFESMGLRFDMQEEFYSSSNRNVIRGMHFQTPPCAHDKLVYCVAGSVDDVMLDLRPGPSYGQIASAVLSSESAEMILIPKGVAHGFRSLEGNSIMVYKTSTEYAPSNDQGIRWDSFGHDWQCANPELSARDLAHPTFTEFQTPFVAS